MPDDEALRKKALSQLRKKRILKRQVQTYFTVNLALIVIWLVTGMGYFWPIWPVLGWGISLAVQSWKLAHPERDFSTEEIEAEMRRS